MISLINYWKYKKENLYKLDFKVQELTEIGFETKKITFQSQNYKIYWVSLLE